MEHIKKKIKRSSGKTAQNGNETFALPNRVVAAYKYSFKVFPHYSLPSAKNLVY